MTTEATSRVLFLLDGERADGASATLRLRGCETHCTEDGNEAARLLSEDRWHAVVLDLDLPDFDVIGLVGALRGHETTRDVTIVARADSLSDDLTELALSRGCDRLIGGRLTDEQLAAEVDRFLAQRPSRVPSPPRTSRAA